MRIISGKYRNSVLISPETTKNRSNKPTLLHPMGDRQRSGLFNTLFSMYGSLTGAKILDAYAGTGAIGLEALSRGAEHVTFLEKNPAAVDLIRQNIDHLKVPQEVCSVLNQSIEVYVKVADSGNTSRKSSAAKFFDIIFADPPYADVSLESLVGLSGYLKPGGLFILSSPSDFSAEQFIVKTGLKLIHSHTYARAKIDIFKKSS